MCRAGPVDGVRLLLLLLGPFEVNGREAFELAALVGAGLVFELSLAAVRVRAGLFSSRSARSSRLASLPSGASCMAWPRQLLRCERRALHR
jgi:hypothetical protein